MAFRAVKFTSKLFGRALSRRIKATVLYATETGKSEGYAKKLGEIFGHAFNAQVYCLEDYDISSIEHEALLLVVTSTFGNGDPPENGEEFARNLYALKLNETGLTNGNTKLRYMVTQNPLTLLKIYVILLLATKLTFSLNTQVCRWRHPSLSLRPTVRPT